jgi:DNA-binding CsgD family transcriptional regulator/ArsR family metal-binding transcriptional regulator
MVADYQEVFSSLEIIQVGPTGYHGAIDRNKCYGAKFSLQKNIALLFPYINAVVEGAEYSTTPEFIRFIHDGHLCLLYGHEGAFTPVADYAGATDFLQLLLDFLENIRTRTEEIVPDHRSYSPTSPVDVLKLLPKSNCHKCGYPSCLAFAAAVSRQKASPGSCPYLVKPLEERSVFPLIDKDGNQKGTITLPIDTRVLYQQVSDQDDYIQALQSRLKALEEERTRNIEENNLKLTSPLTTRELEVLTMLGGGATNKEISEQLFISEHTVKTHVKHIFDKLGVHDRSRASVWAAKNGLL